MIDGARSASPWPDVDRVDELLGADVLEQEAARAGADRLVDVLVQVEGGEDEDARVGATCDEISGRLDPVEIGHPDVHQDHVREQTARGLDCLEAVLGLADHLELRPRLEDHPEAAANERLVVSQEDLDGHSSGKRADTAKPPSARGPAARSPS